MTEIERIQKQIHDDLTQDKYIKCPKSKNQTGKNVTAKNKHVARRYRK